MSQSIESGFRMRSKEKTRLTINMRKLFMLLWNLSLCINQNLCAEELRCFESEVFIDFNEFPDCKAENSCIISNLNIDDVSAVNVERSVHDFECMIFVESLLSEIPSSLFMTLKSNISHLHANDVGLTELRRVSFPIGQRLKSVNLAGNQIRGIKETIFYDAHSLTILNLSRNQISEFSSNAFDKLNRLEILDLSENQIISVPFELFQPLRNLAFLSIRNNRLQIKFGIFPESLRKLDLSYNNVDIYHKFKIFSLLNHLESLLLHGNRIENVHFSIFQSNLKYLGLSENLFSCSTLADIVLEMEKHDVICVHEKIVKNASNIRGIKCSE